MIQSKKITYRSEVDENNVQVHYFINIRFEEKQVWWCFHPSLPKGMHWKKGDETGLGSDHHTDTQSFQDFIENPIYHMPYDKYEIAKQLIQENTI